MYHGRNDGDLRWDKLKSESYVKCKDTTPIVDKKENLDMINKIKQYEKKPKLTDAKEGTFLIIHAQPR